MLIHDSHNARLIVVVMVIFNVLRDRRTGVVVVGSTLTNQGHRGSSHHGRGETDCPPVTDESQLNSYLWTIRRPSVQISQSRSRGQHHTSGMITPPPSYFFGTIHVPYTRVWNYVPTNAKDAFQRSDAVHFELDLLDDNTLSALNACQMLPPGQSIADFLPADIYQRLKTHLDYVRRKMYEWMLASPQNGPDSVHTATDGSDYHRRRPGRRSPGAGAAGNGQWSHSSRGRVLDAANYLFDAIIGDWERKRPVYVLLMVNSLTKNDIRSRGTPVLDLYLAQEATRAGKQRAAVELVAEHCVPLNSMDLSQVLFALNQTLTQYETRRSGFQPPLSSVDDGLAPVYTADDLVHQYNCGDLYGALFSPPGSDNRPTPVGRTSGSSTASVNGAPEVDMTRQINDYFRLELIDKRNRRMAERIDRLLSNNPTTSFFFAFGAGHFIGNNSLIELLRKRGYDVQHTLPGDPIDASRSDTDREFSSVVNASWRSSSAHRYDDVMFTSRWIFPVPVPTPQRFAGDRADSSNQRLTTRHRHRLENGRNKATLRSNQFSWNSPGGITVAANTRLVQRPQFNDLWVRLDPTSFIPDSSHIQQQIAFEASTNSPQVLTSGSAVYRTLTAENKLFLLVASSLTSFYLHFYLNRNRFEFSTSSWRT